MDTSPIPGFITRKQAAEKCERSERTLQRYWSKAVELHDAEVLQHLKLHTEDHDVIEGIKVTKDLIDDLRKNPAALPYLIELIRVFDTSMPRLSSPSFIAFGIASGFFARKSRIA